MMQARSGTKPERAVPPSGPMSTDRLRECIAGLLLEAASFIPLARVEETARGWLARSEPGQAASGRNMLLVADALGMATDLALFTPSASGQTAFDRLARQRGNMGADESAALRVLRQAQFRLLRIEAGGGAGAARLRDLATGEVLELLDESIGPELAGIALVGRLAPSSGGSATGCFADGSPRGDGDGRQVFVGGVTPLDEAGLAVAAGFVRPGGRGLLNPQRCADAVYRHVLRHGTPEIPGLNRPPEDEGYIPPEEVSELDQVALRWAEPAAVRDPEDVQLVRTQSDLGAVLNMLASAANTRTHGLGALSDAYAEIVGVQLEALHRRHAAGSGTLGLDTVAAAVEAEIASGELPTGARDILREVRRRLGTAAPASGKDADLDRLIGRIQALRAKTVEQGCTEQEALAAAEKVAELLDRYGLSLSELSLQRQACEGGVVETSRKRVGPVDDCVPAIAAFFDCRVWGEKGAAGTLRYVFFGLPADVAASRYLHDLVEQAFETETARFRIGATYAAMPTGVRRTASNSFGIGLARGITAKLRALRDAREATLRGASGRDLVVAKAGAVEAELAKLGLQLRTRGGSSSRRVLRDVYEQGHEAGLGFEYTPGVGHDR